MEQVLSLIRPFGVDLFCSGKKFLVFNMVSRNLKIKYRRSILGIFWTLLSPIGQAAIFYFVFKVVMKIQIPHYLAFILGGVLPWGLFSQTLTEGMESILGSVALITKVPIPIQSFPFVVALTNFVTLFLAIPVLIGASLISSVHLGWSLLALIPLLLGLLLQAYSLSLSLGVAFVYFRDLRHLMQIIIQIWFYGTPVVYSVAMIPRKFRWIIYANPVGTGFVGLQSILSQGKWPGGLDLLVFTGWTVFFVFFAAAVYKSACRNLAENL